MWPCGGKEKTQDWVKRFLYVWVSSSSTPDVSDMTDPFRSRWNPCNGILIFFLWFLLCFEKFLLMLFICASHRLVGIPLAPGEVEYVEYFKVTKARDWSKVRRSEVWCCIHVCGIRLICLFCSFFLL